MKSLETFTVEVSGAPCSTVGNCDTKLGEFLIKPEVSPDHSKEFPALQVHKATLHEVVGFFPIFIILINT